MDVGRITAVFGIKGWIKIQSDTEPGENIFAYQPWWLKTRHGVQAVEVDAHRAHGSGYVAHISGVDDRDQAASYCRVNIAIDRAQLPALAAGEYYWHQLQGLRVVSEWNGKAHDLGEVSQILATGANDVLVVTGDQDSLDRTERLIPYVPGQFVRSVDLVTGRIQVEWDPDF